MTFSQVTERPMQGYITSEDRLVVPKPAMKTILPADVKPAKEMDFDETDVVALLKKGISRLRCASKSCGLY